VLCAEVVGPPQVAFTAFSLGLFGCRTEVPALPGLAQVASHLSYFLGGELSFAFRGDQSCRLHTTL
jgi:hypothetical protein